MAQVKFRDYAEVNAKILEGYTVTGVVTAINAEETGVMIYLERTVDNVVLGITMTYNPDADPEVDETELMISEEYVKRIEYGDIYEQRRTGKDYFKRA